MQRGLFLLLCLFFPIFIYAQADFSFTGIRSSGMGGTAATASGIETLCGNIIGIERIKEPSIALTNLIPFGVLALSKSFIAVATPLHRGVIGLQLSSFGNQVYRHGFYKLAFAHKINFVTLGGSVGISQYSIAETGNKYLLIFQFGGQARLSKTLLFGTYLTNLTLSHFQDESPETNLAAGFSWNPITAVMLNVGVSKETAYRRVFKVGIQYAFNKHIIVRTGFSDNPSSVHFGVTLVSKKIEISYAGITHPKLGLSHALSLDFTFLK